MKKHIACIVTLLLTPTSTIHSMQEMVIMMGAQMGASIANQAISQDYQDITKAIAKAQSNMSIASNDFFRQVQSTQQSDLKSMTNIFASAQKQISNLMTTQTQTIQNMQNYIDSIVSLQSPLPNYLSDPINYDEQFTNGTMYTPTGPIWKNINQLGNWQYDDKNNSFWQMQLISFLAKATANKPASEQSAYQNYIFTEWYTKQPYEIACDITIYQVTYPFYVGVIFNKARWISGDTYGIQKYRTLGLFGLTPEQINFCFAQQTTTNSLINYPVTQIYQGTSKIPFNFNATLMQTVYQQPIVIHFKIKPGPNSIEYKVWISPNQEPVNYALLKTPTPPSNPTAKTSAIRNQSTNANNDNDIYLYHGIGFLAPGAIAQFKITSPQQLVYKPAEVAQYSKQLQQTIVQQQNKKETALINTSLLAGK